MNHSPDEDSVLIPPFAPMYILFTSLCFAVALLTMFVPTLYTRYKNGHPTQAFIVFLIINLLLQSLVTAFAAIKSLNLDCKSRVCTVGFIIYKTADLCGLYLHQLVALESVLSLRHTLYTEDLLSLPCSVTLSVSLYLLAYACALAQSDVAFCLPSIGILTMTVVFTCKAPPPPLNNSSTNRKPAYLVLTVAMITIVVAYLPNLVTICIANLIDIEHLRKTEIWFLHHAHLITFSMRSFRMMFDPILCVLVYKKVYPIQMGQPQTNPEAIALQDLPEN